MDDEDVLFEGSALHQYLSDVLPNEDLEVTSKNISTKTRNISTDANPSRFTIFTKLLNRCFFCLRIWSKQREASLKVFPSWLVACTAIKSSGLLKEDDAAFVQAFSRQLVAKDQFQKEKSTLSLIFRFLLLLLVAAWVIFLNPYCIEHLHIVSELGCVLTHMNSLLMFTLFLVVVYFCHEAVQYFVEQRKQKNWCNLLENLVKSQVQFQKQYQKSLCHIQEVEVLSRGYTMVTAHKYATRLEKQAETFQLLPLRHVCLATVTAQLRAVRTATQLVVSKVKVETEYELPEDCITYQRLPEWLEGENRANEITDTDDDLCSLSVLKVLFELEKEQCSDFLRRILLSVVPVTKIHHSSANDFKECTSVLAEANLVSMKQQERLEKTYSLHTFIPEADTSQRRKKLSAFQSARNLENPAVRLMTAMHSVRLHMETGLLRLIPVDDNLCESRGAEAMHEKLDELRGLADTLQTHLDAGIACLQEVRAALSKLDAPVEMKDIDNVKETPPQEENTSPTASAEVHVVGDSDSEDSDEEEKLFEAYVDANMKRQDKEQTDEWLTEKNQKKRDAEDAKKLLQELNSVLTVRSKEKEKRRIEKQMKKRKLHHDLTQGHDLNTPHSSKHMQEPTPGNIRRQSVEQSAEDSAGSDHLLDSRSGNFIMSPVEQIAQGTVESDYMQDSPANFSGKPNGQSARDAAEYPHEYLSCAAVFDKQDIPRQMQMLSVSKNSLTPGGHTCRSELTEESIESKYAPDTESNRIAGEESGIFSTESSPCLTPEDGHYPFQREATEQIYTGLKDDDPEQEERVQLRLPPLAGNSWILPGLAQTVAQISKKKIGLKEDAFGEAESEDESS